MNELELVDRIVIVMGCQSLSRVIDGLFSDLRGKYVFNILEDLVVYSQSAAEHVAHVREVFGTLQAAGLR